MQANFSVSLTEFQGKQAWNSSSTIDGESRHEEPYYYWEPNWFQVGENNNFTDALNICPGCCKIVSETQQKLFCEGTAGHFYYAHPSCISDIFQFTEYTHVAKKIENKDLFTQTSYKIGCREYFVQITIQHPLSANKLYCTSKKMLEFERKLNFSTTQKKSNQLQPNSIVLPLKQFKCCIKISPLFSSEEIRSRFIYFKVDLLKQRSGVHCVRVQDGDFTFVGEFQVVQDPKIKHEIIQNLNFKYKRPYLQEHLVKFNRFFIELKESQIQPNPQMNRNSGRESSKSQNQFTLEPASCYIPQVPIKIEFTKEDQILAGRQFINYIKTQAGSKQFQKKVKNYKHEEIESVIQKIISHLEEVTLNQYSNYMFQSLLAACTFEQRMRIITKVADILTKLVCQQQGTFVFQQLIAFLTNREQFECICVPISKDFKMISLDNNGNHFMRKLVQNMPKQMLPLFMPNVYRDFVQFSKNKNAVCVMKCVLRALKQGEILNVELSQHMKRFLDLLTLNTQQLINDQFGNYLIQEAFQVVSAEKLGGISEYIMNFFSNCACQKFASNVVLNCIKKYWNSDPSIYKTLKQSLDNRNICYMYQNQLGNKILLEVMQLPMEMGVKDKISGVIRNEQPSKFNNQRWVRLTGKSKTGAVGTNYTSFSQAHSFMKRKHYK